MARILIAEDDPNQARVLKAYLEREGHHVVVAHDGRQAIESARQLRPDLVVSDIMMPNVDGLDVIRVLRADGDVPVIFVTARATEDDMLLGLDLGAEDYITKPYSPRELVARIRVVLRRNTDANDQPDIVKVGDLEIDPVRHELRIRGNVVDTTPREFALIAALAIQPGRAFSRREMLTEAVGFDHYVLERTVDMHVVNLRKKIELNPASPRYVLTVKGKGYRLADT